MSQQHEVEDGQYLPLIADKHGFRDYRIIWKHGQNSELREKRKTPSILMPGDLVFIPDKQQRQDSGNTELRHVFQLVAEPLLLRLRLQDLDDQPVVGKECTLEVEGDTIPMTTDEEGVIEREIPSTAQRGVLTIDDLAIPLQIGFLHPVEEISGWRARLNNLGYNAGDADDPEEPQLRSAVEEFQADYGLQVDGVCGTQTQKKLKERHGC